MEQNKFYEIRNMTKHEYTLAGCDGSVITCPIQEIDKLASIFTIQDAKDGDVLASEGCEYLLFKAFSNTDGKIKLYCWYNGQTNNFHVSTDVQLRQEAIIIPATKEQRNLLFHKMHEAGYEWDADRKELRKIENEIEIPFGAKDSELQEVTYYIPQGFHAEIDDNKVVIKKGEKPTAWSEKDEKLLKLSLENLTELKNRFDEGYGKVGDCIY